MNAMVEATPNNNMPGEVLHGQWIIFETRFYLLLISSFLKNKSTCPLIVPLSKAYYTQVTAYIGSSRFSKVCAPSSWGEHIHWETPNPLPPVLKAFSGSKLAGLWGGHIHCFLLCGLTFLRTIGSIVWHPWRCRHLLPQVNQKQLRVSIILGDVSTIPSTWEILVGVKEGVPILCSVSSSHTQFANHWRLLGIILWCSLFLF